MTTPSDGLDDRALDIITGLEQDLEESRRVVGEAQVELVKALESVAAHRQRNDAIHAELEELRSAARVVVTDFERELERLRATDARPYGLTEYGVGGMETLEQFESDVARVRALLGVEDTNTKDET